MASKSKFIATTPHEFKKEDYLISVAPGSSVIFEITDKEKYDKEVLENIRWVAHMIKNKPAFTNNDLHAGLKGSKIQVTFPKIYDGGGLAWIEPVFPDQKPTNIPPNGYFLNSNGSRSIVKVEWRKYQKDNLGALITDTKLFGEAVQLHVYTNGLYGHDIQLKLKDYKNFNYELDFEEKVRPEEYFKILSREVDSYIHVDDPKKHVQKAIFNIQIEQRWKHAGLELQIAALISSNAVSDLKPWHSKTNDEYLKVRTPKPEEEVPKSELFKDGNKPVIIGDVPTDTAEFKPCFYTKIEAIYSKGDEDTTAVLYDSNQGLKPKEMSFAAVAGPRQGRKEVTIKLDADTENCLFIGNENLHHKGKVIDLKEIDDYIVVESSIENKGYRVNNDEAFKVDLPIIDYTLEFEQEDGNHGDNNDNGEFNANHGSSGFSMNSIIGGVKRTSGEAWNSPKKKYSNKATSDTKVIIEVPYRYGKTTNSETLGEVLQYIWPASKSNIQQYPIRLHTCRQPNSLISVNVYPDIKWTLQFCYNTDPEKFQEMRQKYKDYKVRIEQIKNKEDKEGFEEKIDRHKDMADKFKELEKELAGDQKKIDKQRKIAENIKNVGKKKAIRRKKLNAIQQQQDELNQLKKTYKEKQDEHRKKVETYKQQKKKYKKIAKSEKKAVKKYPTYSKSRPGLYDFDDNLEDGISDVVLSLWAEWDRPAERFEVTASYSKYIEMLKTMLAIKKTMEQLLQGKMFDKNSETKAKLDQKAKEAPPGHFAKIKAALNPPLVSFNVIPPSIALAGSWYAENPKSQQQNEIGTNLEFTAAFDPIIGAEIVLNFAGMIRKGFPIINPIMAMMELGGLEVRFDLTTTGTLFAKGMVQYNTATGEGNLMPGELKKLTDKEDDSPLEIGGTIDMELYVGIRYEGSSQAFEFEAAWELNAYASVVTGVTLSGFVEWVENDKEGAADGVYFIPKLTFHGLKVNTKASAKVTARRKNSEESMFETEKSIGGEFVLMDPYESVLGNLKLPLVTS